MTRPVSDIAFTSSVKAVQEQMGSRSGYASMEQQGGWDNEVTPQLESFIADRDTFFLATANADGQPYIQHRGGPRGFLKAIDSRTIGFADFSGNRQYITVGNLIDNSKAFIFLMDFARRRRIKIWGRAEAVAFDVQQHAMFHDQDYGAEPERVILFHIEAWDMNCPKHITPRFTEEEVTDMVSRMQARIADLEAQLEAIQKNSDTST